MFENGPVASRGFTMIELLCVILIVGSLASSALPSLLDLRNEARAAATRQSLAVIREGIKHQELQVRLRCNISNIYTWQTQPGYTFYVVLYDKIDLNDMTAYWGAARYRMCTPTHLPNEADRKLWTVSDSERALSAEFGEIDYDTYSYMPANALINYSVDYVFALAATDTATVTNAGGKCPMVDASSYSYHWWYNQDTGEIWPGTNTPGINECNF